MKTKKPKDHRLAGISVSPETYEFLQAERILRGLPTVTLAVRCILTEWINEHCKTKGK